MRITFPLLAVIAILLSACSGPSGKDGPTAPTVSPASAMSPAHSNRSLLGMWDVTISEDRQTVEIATIRGAEFHVNVVRLLEVAPCTNCLTISNLTVIPPDQLQVDVTLTHPFPGLLKYTGFDVRGIFISQADKKFDTVGKEIAWGDAVPRLLNYDGYTNLFNPEKFAPSPKEPPMFRYIPGKKASGGNLTATLNPFVAYKKDAPRRMFEAGGSETKTVVIKAPKGPLHFGYAVDASWYPVQNVIDPVNDFPLSANCLEAYEISVSPESVPSGVNPDFVYVRVYDHQGTETIKSVTVSGPDFGDTEVDLALSADMGEYAVYSGPIEFNDTPGVYPLLVRVVDYEEDLNLGQIDAWQVYPWEVIPSKGWARTWGGNYYFYLNHYQEGRSVAVDNQENIYVAGAYGSLGVDFDPGSGVDEHSSNGHLDVYLTKFDENGNFIWAKTWGGKGDTPLGDDDYGYSVAVDASGNAFVTGVFWGEVDFDPGPEVENHEPIDNTTLGLFLSKFDSDGNYQWVRIWDIGYTDWGFDVSVDDFGNLYLAGLWNGNFDGMADFDPGPGEDIHTTNGEYDTALMKLDPNGNFLWARTWGGPEVDGAWSAALDDFGNAFVTGYYWGSVDFDPGLGVDMHTSNDTGDWWGDGDVFLSKFDSNGVFLWAKTWGGIDGDAGHSVVIDNSDSLFVTGWFNDTADFDPGPSVDAHTSTGGSDIFLSKFDASGNLLWAKTWGSHSLDLTWDAALDSTGDVFIGGQIGNTVDFDPNSEFGECERGAYLGKFDTHGNYLWAHSWEAESVYSISVGISGSAYATGRFAGKVDFNPGPGIDLHDTYNVNEPYAFLSTFPPDRNWRDRHRIRNPRSALAPDSDGYYYRRPRSPGVSDSALHRGYGGNSNMSINSISGLLGNALLNELNTANLQVGKAFERLATGQRINSASDDAAGLAIASRMEAEQRGLAMAERNAQMGISMAQTAEGYLGSVTEDVQRMRELAVQASNDTLSSQDRQAIQEEINSLRENIDTTLGSAEFNGQKLFTGETRTLQIGADASGTMSFTIPSMSSESLGLSEVDVTTQGGAEAAIAAGDTALAQVLSAQTDLGATQNSLESSIKSLSQTRNDTLSALSGIRDANMAEEALNASRATNRLESLLLLAGQTKKLDREMLPPLLQ